jgi:hypothetical protein
MSSPAIPMANGATVLYGIRRVIFASSVGTMIELYDFYIFGSLAAVLSLKFYPPGNDTFAYVAYLATFAVGLLVLFLGGLATLSDAGMHFWSRFRSWGFRLLRLG